MTLSLYSTYITLSERNYRPRFILMSICIRDKRDTIFAIYLFNSVLIFILFHHLNYEKPMYIWIRELRLHQSPMPQQLDFAGVVVTNVVWVSEWVLFNSNSSIFQLYHGENKLIWNEMMMMMMMMMRSPLC